MTNGCNDPSTLIADLQTSIFEGLTSRPLLQARSNEDATTELRRKILSKLKTNVNGRFPITTVQDILQYSPVALLHILDPHLTYVECHEFLSRIHYLFAVASVSVWDIIQRTRIGNNTAFSNRKISSGLPTLDFHLKGGFPLCSITELVGRAGVGKTQLAQQICVLAAKAEFGGSIYIDTEKKMNVERLREIASEQSKEVTENCGRKRSANDAFSNLGDLCDQILENITVQSILSTDELLRTLNQIEKEIIHRNLEAEKQKDDAAYVQRLRVRVLIIDSIAAPIQRDYDVLNSSSSSTISNGAIQRAGSIFQIARKLKHLAHQFQLAVVVTNQVNYPGQMQKHAQNLNDGEFTGSLGTAWQYCVSTRVMLEYKEDPHILHQTKKQLHQCVDSSRIAVITKSLISKRAQLTFDLTDKGLCEMSK